MTRNLDYCIDLPDNDHPLWVFAYGSLMWNPGFAYDARCDARVFGLHRRFCVSSIHYRGTREAPGLILGLDLGGSCHGRVFRVPAARKRETADYLQEREMSNGVYHAVFARARTAEFGSLDALTFRVRRDHAQYVAHMAPRAVADQIGSCRGSRGENMEYLVNTWETLCAMGIRDPGLERVVALARSPSPDSGRAVGGQPA